MDSEDAAYIQEWLMHQSFAASSLFVGIDIDEMQGQGSIDLIFSLIPGQIGVYNSAPVMQYGMHVSHLSWKPDLDELNIEASGLAEEGFKVYS